jgi:preprotein translocase subunit Sec61beta
MSAYHKDPEFGLDPRGPMIVAGIVVIVVLIAIYLLC